MPTATRPVALPRRSIGSSTGFRPDIQGLRTIAVLLVVLYHIWPSRLTGGFVGVDVFFVISGFLMTAVLLKTPPRSGRAFAEFWARRIRRLVPAALAVLLATGAATWLIAPSTIWVSTARQILASTFYVQNWVLAAHSVNYLAEDDAPSPLQHYWSLSVEEQFYVVWPFLMALAVWWAYRRTTAEPADTARATWRLQTVIGAVFAASLVVSVWYTGKNPAGAYFVTPTRMWELALGGIVAALPAASVEGMTRPARAVLAWLGIAAILVSGVRYVGSMAFPGYVALLPTLGTALVLWARPDGSSILGRLLGLRPVQYVGDISYSLYLVHWPLIVLLPYVSGDLGILDKCAVLVASIALAGLSKRFVEDVFRQRRTPRVLRNTYRYGVAAMVALALAAAGWWWAGNAHIQAEQRAAEAAIADAGPCFGAASMAKGFRACPQDPAKTPVPSPDAAKDDKEDAYADNCWSYSPFTSRPVCHFGDGSVKVALVGNSHAGHWQPALQELARKNNWTVTTYLISQCAPSDTRQQFATEEMADNCHDYGQWVLDQTAHGQYDLILTSNRESVQAAGQHDWSTSEKLAQAGFHSYLKKWSAGGTPIVVLHDLPYPGRTVQNIPDCLAEHAGANDACSGTPASWKWYYPYTAAAAGVPGVHTIDLTKYFCTRTTCPAVIGGVTVYFDASHMTATYSRTLAPYLEKKLDALGFGSPG
ncbi:SGNH hydrolase domain-containing protein [Flexivirga oryzae]|uniref:Peptidoglycan/LPS O-acetylase OafA/YrhL n=1 Tax=Flexivirga oryzae TaxID=1794944 RepID=A0A839NFT2_9MICO|nr:peptidoglycan/LPS O-acetylase OafA/YrhL [Flexivirga oryzae]